MPLLVLFACLIVYGSLYPFDFDASAATPARQLALLSPWHGFNLRDAVGNFLLFLPLGLAWRHLPGRHGLATHKARVTACLTTGLFAFAVQVPQLWLASRDPALGDVWFNLLGAAGGFGLATLVQPERWVTGWLTPPAPAAADRFMRRPPRARGMLALAWLMAGLFLVYGVWPGSGQQGFFWVPWSAYLQGDLIINAIRLGAVVLYSLAFVIVCTRAFGRVRIGVIWLTLMVLLILLVRAAVDIGRAVDIGDVLLPLMCGLIVSSLRAGPPSNGAVTVPQHRPEMPQQPVQPAETAAAQHGGFDRAGAVFFAGAVLVASAMLYVVLRLPGIPYNVRDVFGGGASLPECVLLMASLACAGFAARAASHLLRRAPTGWLFAPVAMLGGCLILHVLIRRAISSETLADFGVAYDITGQTALLGSVSAKMPGLEEALRFAALTYPVLAATALVHALWPSRQRVQTLAVGLGVALMAGFILLAGLITLHWSASDNITELVATVATDGRPGALLLLGVCLVLAVGANSLARLSRTSLLPALATVAAGCGLGWLLFRFGLTSHLAKYGTTLRGVDFLLGPDRQHVLSDTTLFLRWCFVFLLGAALLALPLRYPQHFRARAMAPRR